MTRIADTVSERLTARQETSEDRRRYLETVAHLMTRHRKPSVQFASIPTARCRHNDGDLEIDIGSNVCSQTVTSFRRPVWTLVAQEGLLIHEMGHVLYTDFEAHESIKDQLGMREMSAFHDIVFNPAEDAAIEEQLRRKFNVGRELDTYNANLFTGCSDDARNQTLPQVTKLAILEWGCYDTGVLDDYLDGERPNLVAEAHDDTFRDEVLPEVTQLLSDVMTEPDPKTRYDRMLDFWSWFKDLMRDDLGEDPSASSDEGAYGEAKPDDTSGMTAGEVADELDDVDADDLREALEEQLQAPPQHDWDEILEDEEGDEAADGEDAPGQEAGESDEDSADADEAGAPGSDAGGDGGADESAGDGGDGDDGGQDASGGDGAGGTGGDSGQEWPGHKGHRLVIRD